MKYTALFLTLCSLVFQPPVARAGKTVTESQRQIPIAYDVDILVVGGSSAGVAAAAEAARQGANVFLAAPRTYLGEDICAPLRLWLEPDEMPSSDLARAIFDNPPQPADPIIDSLPFSYETSLPSADAHKDTSPKPSRLIDKKWGDAPSQSVQYDDTVTIVADLADARLIKRVHILVYQRTGVFEVERVTVSIGDNKRDWKEIATIANKKLDQGAFEKTALDLSAHVAEKARYIQFLVQKTERAERVLLGEIVIEPVGEEPAPNAAPKRYPTTPMRVKHALDQAMIAAGARFLHGYQPTDILRDGQGRLAGVVFNAFSGRQAIRAKIVIDATSRGVVARMAGAEFRPWPGGKQTFTRVVVGGEHAVEQTALRPRQTRTPVIDANGKPHLATHYELEIDMPDARFASFARAEQQARDLTWQKDQADASETLFHIPPDPLVARATIEGDWPGADKINLDAFRPKTIEGLYVLGGCADVSRAAAAKLLRPLAFIAVGARVGQAAAAEAKTLPAPSDAAIDAPKIEGEKIEGESRELFDDIRLTTSASVIVSPERSLPVLGEYDVVVVGGGTGGAPAGIGAGRKGASTLVIEYLDGLGGVGTLGLISKYYHGNRVGFTAEMDAVLGNTTWDIEQKKEWYRSELRKAGVEIWFGALGVGALVDRDYVRGVIVAAPGVRGVVLARTIIDSTGSAAIAAAAGASCVYTDGSDIALQGAGLPPRELGAKYTNTDYTFIDDLDDLDIWRAFVTGREKFKDSYDMGQLIDTRERRQIVGDFTLSPLDIYNGRTYPDSVVLSRSNFDSHGFTIHPMFLLQPPDRVSIDTYVPFRCLLPQGLDAILVTGLGVSAHRDVMPVIRMQPDIQNQGYAAGVAAAICAVTCESVRDIDIKLLQKHLVEKGNLPAGVLTDTDPYPLSSEIISDAVTSLSLGFDVKSLAFVLAQPDGALPFLRQAWSEAATTQTKLTYAHTLGVLGDAVGAETLARAVAEEPWDLGWQYTGMGQFGPSMSPLDSLIIALGRTRSPLALAPILEKVALLDAEDRLSHHRAVAMALESIGDAKAARPLAELLRKPNMSGHSMSDIDAAMKKISPSRTDNSTRERSLAELILARALFRCGDFEGVGRAILERYARDLRGHYARHARAVLEEKTSK